MLFENKDLKDDELELVGENELDDVAGGYIYDKNNNGGNYQLRYEVIDDETGEVRDVFTTMKDAREWASRRGISTESIDWNKLKSIRENRKK